MMLRRWLALVVMCSWASMALAEALRTYAHPGGLSFQHPATWRVEAAADAVTLVPPGAAGNASSEGFRVLAHPSPIPADDPRFVVEVDRLMQLFPGSQRATAAETFPGRHGNGVRLFYVGVNAATGQRYLVSVHAVTVGGIAVLVFGGGPAETVTAQEPALRAIAASVTASAAPSTQPPQGQSRATGGASGMVQAWQQRLGGKVLTQLSSYNSGGGGGGMSSKTEIALDASGAFAARSESSVVMNIPGGGGNSGGVQRASGTWRIYEQGSQVLLEMKYDNGAVETNILQANGEQTFINGKRWFVTDGR